MQITLSISDVATLLSKALSTPIEASTIAITSEGLMLNDVDLSVLLAALKTHVEVPYKRDLAVVIPPKVPSVTNEDMEKLLALNSSLIEQRRPLAGNEFDEPPEVTAEELLNSVGKRRP